jgi:hypothetical protein
MVVILNDCDAQWNDLNGLMLNGLIVMLNGL